MAERDLAGEPEQHVEADADDGGEPDQRQHVELIVVRAPDEERREASEATGGNEEQPRAQAHTLRTSARPNRPFGISVEREDDEAEADDLRVDRAEQRGDERLGEAVDEAGEHHAPGAADAAEDGDREGLDAEQGAHGRGDREQRRHHDAGDAGKQARERERERGDALHVDAHQAGRAGVLHDGQQRLAVAGASGRRGAGRSASASPTTGIRICKSWILRPAMRHRLRREEARRHAARVLAEGEEDGVLEHDAERDGRHQPGVGAAPHERDAPPRARRRRPRRRRRAAPARTATQQRPAQCHPQREAQDGAQHHGAALREVDRVGHGVGDMEAQRQQPVHAAEAETGDERRADEHGMLPSPRGGRGEERGYCVGTILSPS